MKRILRTLEEKNEILKKSNFKCAHCGCDLTAYNTTVDHVYPIEKNGEDIMNNLVALCYDCNQKKSNFTYASAEYYPYLTPKALEITSEYADAKCFTINSPLGNMDRFVYMYSDVVENTITKEKDDIKKRILLNKAVPKFVLSQAYPKEAEELLKFIIKARNYSIKKVGGKANEYKPYDKWLALRTLEDTIRFDKVYTISNNFPGVSNNYVEYKGLVIFNQLKDLTITSDPDNIHKKTNINYFLSAYDLYKTRAVLRNMLITLSEYGKINDTFVPILEMCKKEMYGIITADNENGLYSYMSIEYKNTTHPIIPDKKDAYDDYIFFFRVPKCFVYGQPMSERLYLSVVEDIFNSAHSFIFC